MCVIACKPAGVDMPKQEYMDNMWCRNDDGAGFMYALNGKVFIEKGFMDFDALKARLDKIGEEHDLKKLPLVMHFRITTHGGTKPENCHPFPVSDSVGILSKLMCTTDLGVAHNGIIEITPRKGISDTMEYVISQLSPLKKAVPMFYKNKSLMEMISNAIKSKMAFLAPNGEIYTIGKFEEADGIMYSNDSYKCGYPYSFCYGKTSLAPYHWNARHHWDDCSDDKYYSYRSIMWLDDGQYVSSPSGEFICNADYGIDCLGNVYKYNSTLDVMDALRGYDAYNENGMPLHYNAHTGMVTLEKVFITPVTK